MTVDSDGVVVETRTSYEYGEAPTPSRRTRHSRRHRSRRQCSRDVNDDPPGKLTIYSCRVYMILTKSHMRSTYVHKEADGGGQAP